MIGNIHTSTRYTRSKPIFEETLSFRHRIFWTATHLMVLMKAKPTNHPIQFIYETPYQSIKHKESEQKAFLIQFSSFYAFNMERVWTIWFQKCSSHLSFNQVKWIAFASTHFSFSIEFSPHLVNSYKCLPVIFFYFLLFWKVFLLLFFSKHFQVIHSVVGLNKRNSAWKHEWNWMFYRNYSTCDNEKRTFHRAHM